MTILTALDNSLYLLKPNGTRFLKFLWQTAVCFRLSSFRKHSSIGAPRFQIYKNYLFKTCKKLNISIDFCLSETIHPEAFNRILQRRFILFLHVSSSCISSSQISSVQNVYDAFSHRIMWPNCGYFMVKCYEFWFA